MCRNIRRLYNFDPPASDEEVRAAAIQYVRKVSGYAKPSAANEEAFDAAATAIAAATRELLDGLVTRSAPLDRDEYEQKQRERAQHRRAVDA
ncbi:MAG TPA: DUF2277 domain-containing protein [Candidatus Stackebrandtia faecavium]|nr:DUF2277 domain-containing protein [Candidatus Stackebrandtia faecavium]